MQSLILETRGILSLDQVFLSLSKKVREGLAHYLRPDLALISCAASLAHRGLLDGALVFMGLRDVDLTSVPGEQLASLVSCVTDRVSIWNVSGMLPILEHVSCDELYMYHQTLETKETQALVQAMRSRVKRVRLREGVTLDIGALAEYDGQGKCRDLWCYGDTVARYREQLINLATTINWELSRDVKNCIEIKKGIFI